MWAECLVCLDNLGLLEPEEPVGLVVVEELEVLQDLAEEQVVQEVPLELNLILSPEASAEWTQL